MKVSFNVLIILATIISFGCGANKTSSSSSASSSSTSSQSAVIQQSIVGTWTGNRDGDFVTLTIKSDATVVFKSLYETSNEKLVQDSSTKRYYISDSYARKMLPVQVDGNRLSILEANGYYSYFSK